MDCRDQALFANLGQSLPLRVAELGAGAERLAPT